VMQDMINDEEEVIFVKIAAGGTWLWLGERGEKRVYG